MKRKNAQRKNVKRACARCRLCVGLVVLVTFHVSRFTVSNAEAAPSPEDVFRSVSDSAAQRQQGGHATALLLCGAGGLILLLLLGTRARRQQAAPQPLNHSRKLMREVMKTVPLRRAELKQLRLLAESPGIATEAAGGTTGEAVQSPLTLLLCPSVLARALKNRPPRVDRAVIARIVRKMDLEPRSR